jgi:elongation of very long chain fatty acids protein 6
MSATTFEFNIISQSIENVSQCLSSSLSTLMPMFELERVNHELHPNVTVAYSHIFGFERVFESREFVDTLQAWMNKNWWYSGLISLVYILFIFLGRYLMSQRPRFELRKPLLVWNVTLALFSLLGTIRTWPEFYHALVNRGIVYSVCDISYAYSITGFWAFLFIMSKLPELIDTVFIILRKQQLIFLHW